MTQRKAFHVHKEEASVAQIEAFIASTHACFWITQTFPSVVGVSAASGWKVGAVQACGLNQTCSQEGMLKPYSVRLLSQIGFYAHKSGLADAFFHLAEVRLCRCPMSVAADPSQIPVPIQPLHKIPHVGDLF
jgi:hypothetical protein